MLVFLFPPPPRPFFHLAKEFYLSGHPVPRPELVDQKPQVGGSRSGLLTAFPRTVDKETFLRGAWPTDRNGVAQFTSV